MRKRNRLYKHHPKETFFDTVNMPTDVIIGEAVLMLHENRRLQIQNVKGIIDCTSEHIRIITKKHRIEILGQALQVYEYSKEELLIEGNIEQIIYLEKFL